ncbi:hypothetical protein [Wolbachia endosymbiont of Onchocerca volvulus]|uniref:hypothetical protein n=1 Tax=Onchocerca volvulus endobacterium TaxID=77551 RepID=UPI00046CF19B|nr:hypothetical protein [Wolbachia endosymbiont of Onchocerca volvulus]
MIVEKDLALGSASNTLKSSIIYALDLGSFLARTPYRGNFKEKIKSIIKTIETKPGASFSLMKYTYYY